MQLRVIFDKYASDKNLQTGWGVSFLINDKILFDTGEDGKLLINNMESLKVKFDKLEAVVISHDHWDHTGGLWEILKRRENIDIYTCPNFSSDFKERVKIFNGKLIENTGLTKIAKDVYVTGEIAGKYTGGYIPEQALAVRTNKGISIITGCAHPGILVMVKNIKNIFPKENFYLVCGGFHLMDKERQTIEPIAKEFKRLEIKKVGATHCTGDEAEKIFKDEYKQDFVTVKVGQTIEI